MTAGPDEIRGSGSKQSREVVGGDEREDVSLQAFEIGVVEELGRRVLDRPVHALGLAVRPRGWSGSSSGVIADGETWNIGLAFLRNGRVRASVNGGGDVTDSSSTLWRHSLR